MLVPEPDTGEAAIDAELELSLFPLGESGRSICTETVLLRLRGARAHAPASIVTPLLVSDLPVFCRWRGEPTWGSGELSEVVGVVDRLVVDSSEWRSAPAGYGQLAALFDRVAVSDIAYSRTLPWRRRLAERWPGIGAIEKLRVEGPRADAELLAGWLRARLKRDVALSRREAPALTAVWVDGDPVASPGEPLGPSELLSAELDQFGRDRVYEAAVHPVGP